MRDSASYYSYYYRVSIPLSGRGRSLPGQAPRRFRGPDYPPIAISRAAGASYHGALVCELANPEK